MRIIEHWPQEDKKQSFTDMIEPLLDGQIYQFFIDDCPEWRIAIESIWDHSSEEEKERQTKYLRSRALGNLMDKMRGAVLKVRGPYQTRFLFKGDTLLFQFTGLRECRLSVCSEMAVDGGKGYCHDHHRMKLLAGKVT